MTRNLTTRLGGRRRRPRRLIVLASTAALVAGLLVSGTTQASFVLGGTWGAYDENGNQLNVGTRDIFGSDGASIFVAPIAHAWVDGPDGAIDEGPQPSEFFINGDLSCSSEPPRLYYSNDSFQQLCWARSFSAVASTPGPWGEAFPIVAKGLDDSDLVFDHWQISGSPDVDECFTGEIGIPQFYSGPLLVDGPGGESDPVLSVGYKAFIDHSTESGFSGFDFTANAVYAPLTPDTSAPVVTIVEPLDCSVIEAGGSLMTSFNCVDPGASDPSPLCVGDVANGTSVDTSTAGPHTFSVTGTDAVGNARTRTIHYTVLPATPPETTIDTNPTNPSISGSATFAFSGSDNAGAVAGFECSLDAVAFAACSSAQSFSVADGSHTFAVRAIDGLGHVDPTPATFTWTVDTARPDTTITVHPNNPSGTGDATFEFEASDVGTGVAAFQCSLALDLPGWTTTPCNDIDAGTGAHTQSYSGLADGYWVFQVAAVDAAGNGDPSPATFVWYVDSTPVDTTDPVITISSPTATTYLLNQSVAADYSCTDVGGPPICAGPVANGALIDTASVGSKSFIVNAEDDAGNTASVTVSYSVHAGFGGFQQPIDTTALNVAKAGRTIPVKWRIIDANGLPVTSWPTATVTATSLSCSLGSTPDQIEEYAGGASGLQNLGDGYYQFNWATPKTYANSCKTLHLALGDGADHTAQFQFTK